MLLGYALIKPLEHILDIVRHLLRKAFVPARKLMEYLGVLKHTLAAVGDDLVHRLLIADTSVARLLLPDETFKRFSLK